MKKKLISIVSVFMVIAICFFNMAILAADDNATTIKKFNVVFAVDASNSMNYTDSQGWRFEAIDQFMSLLSNKGNYVGTVAFNGEILSENGVSAINTKKDKKSASDAVKNVTPIGYTNIGAALIKANELLANGDKDLPSVIILLSDGNTEMPSVDEYNASVNAQKDAINDAKNNDTQIYCVGLNANGKISSDELSNISQQTNGVFQIVSKPDDLKDVFKQFYKLIYGTGGVEVQNVELPAVKEFVVPKIGVEEVNILIDGQPSTVSLTQPSGVALSTDEINSMISKGAHFTNIKIEKPLSGAWKLELGGQPGQTVTINFIPNLNVSLQIKQTDAESYKRGEDIQLIATILSDGEEVTDNSVYQEYPATLTITKANDSGNIQTVTANAIDGKYKADLKLDETGTYYVTPSIDIGYGKISGNTISLNVGNMVPKVDKERILLTEYVLGFGDKSFTYDLNNYVKDEDGEKLKFTIDKNSFNTGDIEGDIAEQLSEDGILTICPLKATKGEITVIATDESGASCEFIIELSYRDLLIFVLLILAIAITVAVVLVVIIKYKSTHKAYNGSISVTAYDDESGEMSSPMTEWPAKKPIDIAMINADADCIGGIRGTFFGSGKDYVLFKTKGITYHNGQKVSRVRINDGSIEKISAREDGTKGVEISFNKQESQF